MIAADAEVFVSRQEFAYKPLNRFKGFFYGELCLFC